MEYEIIHSKNLMMYLVRKGFDVVKIDDSEKNHKLKVFMFYKTEDLTNAIYEYSNSKKSLTK